MKGDFMGFSFNGIHSSQLGITRVSDGDRYEEQLFPEINDRNNEIIGNDGELYFGSEFRNKPINIEIAFDSMTELQFRKLRRLFGTKKICELIFDERPYKVYYVKLASPIDLKYVCFDEPLKQDLPAREGIRVVDRDGDHITRETIYPSTYVVDENGRLVTERIYKGEGTIEFRLGRSGVKPSATFSISSTDYNDYVVDVDPQVFTGARTIYIVASSATDLYVDAWQAFETASGIQTLSSNAVVNTQCYDLSGRRLSGVKQHRGIVIEQYTDENGVKHSRKILAD